ncbi:MAG: dephospho-CoA kinase [Bdellovibrionales bacterium]
MLWIGLTGGLGSGKSTVAKLLRELGYTVVDADEMARLAVGPNSEGLTKVLHQFGSHFQKPNGELDRKKLADLVFKDAEALKKLEAIVHPVVGRLTEERRLAAENRGEKVAFYDVPLLFEKNMQKRFAKIVVVDAPEELQISRTMAREGWGRKQVLQRLNSQMPLAEKTKQADFVVRNHGSLADLKMQVGELVNKLEGL